MSNYFDNSEWKLARLGKFTSSEIHKLMKGGRKKDELFGQGAMTYINEKIAEIITGEAKQLENIKALEWGAANELDACMLFEQQHNEKVEFFGVGNPQYFSWNSVSGGSPDGLTESAVIEVKCPYNSANHIEFLMASLRVEDQMSWLQNNWPEYYAQVQFNMMCCDKQVGYLISYDPRTVSPQHRLAVLQVGVDPTFRGDVDQRIKSAKEIVNIFLEAFNQVTNPSIETPMPWGKHKGVALINVPADYLIWIYENSKAHGKLAFYIKRNWETLKAEVAKGKNVSKN